MDVVVSRQARTSRRRRARSRFSIVVLAVCLGAAVLVIPASPATAVVNGTEVTDLNDRWPFIVKVGSGTLTGCGGVLIDPEWVITAAHCNDGNLTHVHYGDVSESALTAVPTSDVYEFPQSWSSFDMALVRLETPLDIPLATFGSGTPAPGDTVWTAGWGATTTSGGGDGDVLREGSMTVQDESTAPSGSQDDMEYVIWAGESGQADACWGDSGGPLVNAGGELVGVVSRSLPWGNHDEPCGAGGFYTDLTHPTARQWLANTMNPVVVDTQAPTITEITAAPELVVVGSPVTISATIDDTGTGGSIIAGATMAVPDGEPMSMDATDGSFDGPVEEVTGTITASAEGDHVVCVTGTDAVGRSTFDCAEFTAFQPSGDWSTSGNGTVDLPSGGAARFEFVSRYRNRGVTPQGPFNFHVTADGQRFSSTEQTSLWVTDEPRARFQGVGLLNGSVQCSYLVDVWDGSHATAGGDAFGVRIFDCGGDGASLYEFDAQPLTRGKIRVVSR